MSEGPIHVIIQDVLQGTCISFLQFATAVICPKPNNTRPYSQIATDSTVLAICYKYLTHREKANLDSQEVHDNTFCIRHLRSMIHDYSGFIIFCGEY